MGSIDKGTWNECITFYYNSVEHDKIYCLSGLDLHRQHLLYRMEEGEIMLFMRVFSSNRILSLWSLR